MKRRTFLGSIAALLGATRVAAEPEPAELPPNLAGCIDAVDREIAKQVLGTDLSAQAMIKARARRDIDEGELLLDDDVDHFGRVEKINDDGTIDVAISGPVHPVGVRVGVRVGEVKA